MADVTLNCGFGCSSVDGCQGHCEAPITLAICGAQPECDHDWHGPGSFLRLFDDNDGGERVCGKCGIGAMAYTLSLDF